MKIISVWQPFASLLVRGCKVFETRTWPAPKSLIGQRIGIASTKTILPAQRFHCEDAAFLTFYETTGLASFAELPMGYLLGTVLLDSVELMTEELLEDVSDEEQAYGWWDIGNYGWRVAHPVAFDNPIPIRGKQGIYDWNGELPDGQKEGCKAPDQERS